MLCVVYVVCVANVSVAHVSGDESIAAPAGEVDKNVVRVECLPLRRADEGNLVILTEGRRGGVSQGLGGNATVTAHPVRVRHTDVVRVRAVSEFRRELGCTGGVRGRRHVTLARTTYGRGECPRSRDCFPGKLPCKTCGTRSRGGRGPVFALSGGHVWHVCACVYVWHGCWYVCSEGVRIPRDQSRPHYPRCRTGPDCGPHRLPL